MKKKILHLLAACALLGVLGTGCGSMHHGAPPKPPGAPPHPSR